MVNILCFNRIQNVRQHWTDYYISDQAFCYALQGHIDVFVLMYNNKNIKTWRLIKKNNIWSNLFSSILEEILMDVSNSNKNMTDKNHTNYLRKVWRYQRCNQKPWGTNDTMTKRTNNYLQNILQKTKEPATRIPLKIN